MLSFDTLQGRDTIASLRGLLHGRPRIGVARPLHHRLVEALGDFHRSMLVIEIVLTGRHNERLFDALATPHRAPPSGLASIRGLVRVRPNSMLAVSELPAMAAWRHLDARVGSRFSFAAGGFGRAG
jgi:hypothetical protein